jgi:hypothetical protein
MNDCFGEKYNLSVTNIFFHTTILNESDRDGLLLTKVYYPGKRYPGNKIKFKNSPLG